jgi:ribonucleoside-diphosphate reductase beta chain
MTDTTLGNPLAPAPAPAAGTPTLPGLERGENILDPGFSLTLRPMRYPGFYEMYRNAIANTWTVEEVDFSTDLVDLRDRLSPEQHHLVKRLVAFFATGDSIVGNNLVLNLYRHINSPEARMYLGRQLYEEMLHVQFYLTLLDNYVPDARERQAAFAAVENIPSIKRKADFCFKWMGSMAETTELRTIHDRRRFLLHLICFAACIEGLFFFAAFAYVYFLRDRGLLKGLADGTNWVFRDESMHMNFGFEVVRTVRAEEPELWTDELQRAVQEMLAEAIECEMAFARDMLGDGIPGLSLGDIGRYLEHVADQRLTVLGMPKHYGTRNPFGFMDLQDVQSLSNFFERGNASYQIGITGKIDLDASF